MNEYDFHLTPADGGWILTGPDCVGKQTNTVFTEWLDLLHHLTDTVVGVEPDVRTDTHRRLRDDPSGD